jgi:hypothetical protein
MPLLPASLIEPLWVEFAALIGSAQRSGGFPLSQRGQQIAGETSVINSLAQHRQRGIRRAPRRDLNELHGRN